MTRHKISLRRLFDDYCSIVNQAVPDRCQMPDCNAPSIESEYGAICLAGHIVDDRGYIPPSLSIDLALSLVPVVWGRENRTVDIRRVIRRYDVVAIPIAEHSRLQAIEVAAREYKRLAELLNPTPDQSYAKTQARKVLMACLEQKPVEDPPEEH